MQTAFNPLTSKLIVYPYICGSHLDLLAILGIIPFKREGYTVGEIQTMFRRYKHKSLKISTIYKMISDLNKQDLISKNKVTYMNSKRTYYSLKGLQEFTPPVEIKEPAKSFLSWFLGLWKRKN